jgi:hypothetical protein
MAQSLIPRIPSAECPFIHSIIVDEWETTNSSPPFSVAVGGPVISRNEQP